MIDWEFFLLHAQDEDEDPDGCKLYSKVKEHLEKLQYKFLDGEGGEPF